LYELHGDNNWLPDLDALEKTDLTRVKVLWANYPHMPTGAPGSAEVFQQLVDFGKRHDILIINDIYQDGDGRFPAVIFDLVTIKFFCLQLYHIHKLDGIGGLNSCTKSLSGCIYFIVYQIFINFDIIIRIGIFLRDSL
jgi:hypothetical protein